jgi:hypothetical protein
MADISGGWLFFGGLIVFIGLYIMFIAMKSFSSVLRLHSRLKRAHRASPESNKGDYVVLGGRLLMPETRAPVFNTKCATWMLVIKAVFFSQKKKPNKGTQKHTPVIYKAHEDNSPFIIANSTMSAQLCFKNNIEAVLNPLVKRQESNTLPKLDEEVPIQSKYKHYESILFAVPHNRNAIVWGTVIDKTENCIMLARSKNAQKPTMVYIGMEQSLHNFLFKSKLYHALTFFSGIGLIVCCWLQLLVETNLFYVGSIFGISLSLCLLFRKLANRTATYS